MHTPETAGAKAVYLKDGSPYSEFERDLIGWDKQGRPLVMCGDQLEPAATAPFAHHAEFLTVSRPDFMAVVREAVWDSLAGLRERVSNADVEQIIHDVAESGGVTSGE